MYDEQKLYLMCMIPTFILVSIFFFFGPGLKHIFRVATLFAIPIFLYFYIGFSCKLEERGK